VRVIVGFNHEPAPAGRVYAAAHVGDNLGLTQALDDGCSTQEMDMVRDRYIRSLLKLWVIHFYHFCLHCTMQRTFPHVFLVQGGFTPLHYAAGNRRIEAVRLLLEAGAPASPVNKVRVCWACDVHVGW
jgi:hypothetical protein